MTGETLQKSTIALDKETERYKLDSEGYEADVKALAMASVKARKMEERLAAADAADAAVRGIGNYRAAAQRGGGGGAARPMFPPEYASASSIERTGDESGGRASTTSSSGLEDLEDLMIRLHMYAKQNKKKSYGRSRGGGGGGGR